MTKNLGQLFITGISGTSLTKEEASFLEKENIGGVILFSHNYEDPAQLAELVNQIQMTRNEYPLFIAADQEGGRVQRFKEPFSLIPSAYDLSRLDSPKLTFQVATIIAEELKCVGVNFNLGPVCDIWTQESNKVIGDRAFGKDEETVSKFVSSVIRGFQTNGIISCAKHFPGHGDTKKDSHFDLPIVKNDLELLRKREFSPFVKAIRSRCEAVMMAHLVVDALDQEMPTSLSSKCYEFLRKECKFSKVIITDDMEMGAIKKKWSVEDACLMALQAGADIVEYKSFENTVISYEAAQNALKKKELANDSVTEKINRVDQLKKQYLKNYQPIYIPDITKTLARDSSKKVLAEVAEKLASLG